MVPPLGVAHAMRGPAHLHSPALSSSFSSPLLDLKTITG
jgi:hypothetical protein